MKWNKPNNSKIISKLNRPEGKVRLVIDSDAYNEIDDQYAIAYALKKQDRLQIEAIYAAPFFNDNADSVQDGMEKSYAEIKRLLHIMKREDLTERVYKGSVDYLKDEDTPQESEAARDLAQRAMAMPEGEILYVAAIGAITNIASALLMEPAIVDKIVLIWLGGHAHYWKHTKEFNLIQDVAAARVVFDSGVPMVQIPCMGVTSHLATTEPELRAHLKGKSEIGDYLYQITCDIAARQEGKYWSRIIWDISTIMWLVGPQKCLSEQLVHSPIVTYDGTYSVDTRRHFIKVISWFERDQIFEELFTVLGE
ncbi:MAG: nucleoside hydrolase [Tyzzerella sp.]|nr:nucleoside hydrolase [Tyzzerella sp.]